MEEKQELQALLERMERSNQKQAKYSKLQCVFTGAAALCCGVLLFLVIGVIPQVRALAGQMETVMTNLENVTAQLASIDLEDMADNMDSLMTTGRSSLEQIITKLNSIDFEKLNEAIRDLSNVAGPMARMLSIFG